MFWLQNGKGWLAYFKQKKSLCSFVPENQYLPFIRSNIPATPAYIVYISQLIRYSRGVSYHDFLCRWLLIVCPSSIYGFWLPLLVSSNFSQLQFYHTRASFHFLETICICKNVSAFQSCHFVRVENTIQSKVNT
jgi:hypothetical protein